MGLDYVDIFYSHRFDPSTPLEETMGALDTRRAAGQGAVRRHLVLLAGAHPPGGARSCASSGTPLLIHQPSYSMLNRWIEDGLLEHARARSGVGCIAFSPLAQGMLTEQVPRRHPRRTRARCAALLPRRRRSPTRTSGASGRSNDIAQRRGQTLAQMALAWALRDPRVTSALIGARTVEQLEDTLAALRGLAFSDDELARIDALAGDAGINIWRGSSSIGAVE